jgi:hypothetical protein
LGFNSKQLSLRLMTSQVKINIVVVVIIIIIIIVVVVIFFFFFFFTE